MQKIIYENDKGQSIVIGNTRPFLLVKIDGIGGLNTTLITSKNPNQDGVNYHNTLLNERIISIEGGIVGQNRDDVFRKRQKLLSIFSPKSRGKLTYINDTVKRTINCVVESGPIWGEGVRRIQKFMIQLYCPDPYWLDQEKTTDLVTWIPNLEFDAVEGFSTEQLENHWIETQIKKQGLQVFKKGTIYLELEEESTVPEVEIAYLLENGQYKRLKQQATVFSTGTGYDENGNYVDVSDSVVNGQISEITLKGITLKQLEENSNGWSNSAKNGSFEDDFNNWMRSTIDSTIVIDTERALFGNKSVKIVTNNNIRYITQNIDGSVGDKFYVSVWCRKESGENALAVILPKGQVTGAILTFMTANDFNNMPTGEWRRFSGIAEATNDGITILFGRNLNTTYEVNFDGIVVINMTQLGIEDYTKEQMDSIVQNYFEGTKSTVCAIRLKSVNEDETKESTLYVLGKDEEGNILELHSLPNGVKDEIDVANRKLIKRIGEKANVSSGTVINYTDMAEGGTYYAWNNNGETETGTKGDTLGIDATVLIYQLANPIVKLLPPEPLTTFEEFESGIGVGELIEFGYRLTKQIVEIENIGDVDAPIRVVFRAHGQVEKPYIQDVETREMIRINKTLEAGDVLVIITELGNKNVFLNGEKAHHYLDFLNSTWIQLKPGTNLIKYGAENGVELLECRLFYTPRYLGV